MAERWSTLVLRILSAMNRTFLFLCTIAFLFSANRSLAQSFFDFIHIHDSTGVGHCEVPSTVPLNVTTRCSGDFAGMAVTITVYWGDGSDTTLTSIMPFFDHLILQVPHTYTAAGEYYTHGIASLSNGMTDSVYSTNPVTIHTSCVHVSGKVYLDENQNCTYDGNDTLIVNTPQLDLVSDNDTVAEYPVYDGAYSFDVGANQNYTLRLGHIPLSMESLCPNSINYTFTTDTSDILIDFALICTAAEPDNRVADAWITGAIPGSASYLVAILQNANCLPGSGTLTIVLDSLHEYINSDIIPASVNGNIITFNFSNLVNFPYLSYVNSLTTRVNPNSLPGDSFCIDILITPDDLNPLNNVKYLCGVIGGPYDPNHKRVSPLGTGIDAVVPPGTELTYKIEFQNTGNAPAINVILRDTLDPDFDLSTFQVTGSSHPMTYTLNQNVLDFSFQNIMLPDSGNDETGSHGWVSYKIKPNSSAPLGTVVTNTASIYFDNNPPILTNTTSNTFDNATGIILPTPGATLFAYPNPARDEIQFSLPENFQGEIEIRNMLGSLIWFHVESSNFKLATNQFAPGIYQMVAKSGMQNYSVKFAVVK